MSAIYASHNANSSPGASVPDSAASLYIGTRARVAVYDCASSAPYVEDVPPAPVSDYIHALAARVYELARERGGPIPYTVVREVAENLVHAGFAEPVVSVLDDGYTIRFTDQGPGIADKGRALEPGFTTATAEMKTVIRGVGSGLPIVNEFLSLHGGSLSIEDNLVRGSVVTLRAATRPSAQTGPQPEPRPKEGAAPTRAATLFEDRATSASPRLTTRQKQVLALVLEAGSAGPSLVSRELGVGLSTAYRDLASLEELGLIEADGGKRSLTADGLMFLGAIASPADSKPGR